MSLFPKLLVVSMLSNDVFSDNAIETPDISAGKCEKEDAAHNSKQNVG